MDTFQTHSTARKSVITILFTFFLMFVLAFLGLKVAVATWLFLEGILLVSSLFCLLLGAKTHWEIEFQGRNLTLTNTGNHQRYYFDALTLSDFQVTQSRRQAKRNSCDLKIKNTSFGISDVQKYDAFLQYLQQHFGEEEAC